jgi:hypothetical protein
MLTRPAAWDWLSYLRYRAADGPEASADADRILVAQPGIPEGAGAFDSVARDTVARAAEQGRFIEFWALDRRSNCLEDRTGSASGDQHAAVDYYYRGKEVGGRTFDGYVGNGRTGWLAKPGIEQSVRNEYDLLAAELPDQRVRKRKVLCGGHSLGGVITREHTDRTAVGRAVPGDHPVAVRAGIPVPGGPGPHEQSGLGERPRVEQQADPLPRAVLTTSSRPARRGRRPSAAFCGLPDRMFGMVSPLASLPPPKGPSNLAAPEGRTGAIAVACGRGERAAGPGFVPG